MGKSKIGILQYIASAASKGVKFEDEPDTWYNPKTEEAKAMVKDEYKDKQVEIQLVEGKKTEFTSMVLLEAEKEGETETPEEEVNKEDDTLIDLKRPEEIEKDKPEDSITGEEILTLMTDSELYTKEAFKQMEQTKVEASKKGNLTYASWGEIWGLLKNIHPTATFKVYENEEGLPYFMGKEKAMGAFVKVSVTVMGLKHSIHLPVMNHMNKSIMGEEMTSFDVNKNIMRALVKCIALHGLGLYIFKGEEFNDDDKNK